MLNAQTVAEFKAFMLVTSADFAAYQSRPDLVLAEEENKKAMGADEDIKWYHVGKGIMADFMGRFPFYLDDFKDGITGNNTLQKTTATTLFLYFSVILPAVALGVLNSYNTDGEISVLSLRKLFQPIAY